jgi:hypothetical protein
LEPVAHTLRERRLRYSYAGILEGIFSSCQHSAIIESGRVVGLATSSSEKIKERSIANEPENIRGIRGAA